MIDGYLVTVRNDINEEITFNFKELHDALTLYRACKHDETVTLIIVDSVQTDNEGFYTGTENVRYYEKGVDYVHD